VTDAEIARYYADLLSLHGPTFRAGDYGSAEGQAARFNVLADILPTNDKHERMPNVESVLDVGCGVGDFTKFIPATHYTGWDFSTPIIEAARTAHPGYRFDIRDFKKSTEVGAFDLVIASGVFQFRGLTYLKTAVKRMVDLAKVAVAFNVLTATTLEEEVQHDPGTVLRYCRTLTPRVICRAEYRANDATFFLYKETA
jgi:SAM-dependent methyltransferase